AGPDAIDNALTPGSCSALATPFPEGRGVMAPRPRKREREGPSAKRWEGEGLPRHQHPVIEIENYRRMVRRVGAAFREVGAIIILQRHGADAQGTRMRSQFARIKNLRPGIDRVAAEARGNMAPAIHRENATSVFQAIET